MKVLITGMAGFIGFHTAMHYHNQGWNVVGFDNFNDYYDPKLKYDRAEHLRTEYGIDVANIDLRSVIHEGGYDSFYMDEFIYEEKPDLVIHLAAMAGVRYSMDHPQEYIDVNITGTQNLINACERAGVQDVIYASTSCTMHGNPLPWSEGEKLGKQLSPYGYSKANNEHQFHISKIPNAVCLRFFTVYGPWGRPDMALFDFTNSILADKTINVFNNGDMKRDFTYVTDIVQGIWLVSQNMNSRNTYCIGNGRQVDLMDFIGEIEKNLDKTATKNFVPAHPADALETWSDTTKISKLGYKSTTSIEQGVELFIEWYRNYFGKNT